MPECVSVGCRVTMPHGCLSGIWGYQEILARWSKSSDATRTRGPGGERGHVLGNCTKDRAAKVSLHSWVSGGKHIQDDIRQSACPCPPHHTHTDSRRDFLTLLGSPEYQVKKGNMHSISQHPVCHGQLPAVGKGQEFLGRKSHWPKPGRYAWQLLYLFISKCSWPRCLCLFCWGSLVCVGLSFPLCGLSSCAT